MINNLKKINYFLMISCLILLMFSSYGCSKENLQILGVWWWDSNLEYDTYLNFAKDNGVNEIYYCDSKFDGDTANFIKKANSRQIKVYFLAGEYQWINDRQPLFNLVNRFLTFQKNNPQTNFEGIHLDIEPHQDPNFKDNRALLLENFVSLVYDLKTNYKQIKIDYDIPFWIHDEISFNGNTKPCYAHIIENSNRTFLMSYRDTAEAIYNVSKEEIEFAKSVNKTLVLGVETKSSEGDNVSFMEEGKIIMNRQLQNLRKMLPKDFGISIHQIKTWFDLKD